MCNLLRYRKLANAEVMTQCGQLSVRWIEKIHGYLINLLSIEGVDNVIVIDTDTIYLNYISQLNIIFLHRSKFNGRY